MKTRHILSGELGLAGEMGSGNLSNSSNSSFFAPLASFLACVRLIYCIISSSPRTSSSSTELATGEGVEIDCRLDGEPLDCCWWMFGVVDDPERRDAGRDIFGLRSLLIPFDGEAPTACECASKPAVDAIDETEPVDDFRNPFTEIESWMGLRALATVDEEEAEKPEANLKPLELLKGELLKD